MFLARACMAAAGGNAYRNVVLTDKPVAFWPLNETSGTVAADISGHDFNGTYTGGITLADIAGIPGAGGNAPVFDGSSGYVTGSQLLTASTINVTLEAWVNFQGNASPNGGCFFKNGQYNNGYAIGNGGTIMDNAGDNIIGLYEDQSWNPTTATYPTSGWNHIVMVIGSNSESTFYLNGAEVATNANSSIIAPGAQWMIAADEGGRLFAGALSNIAIYNTVLTPARILAHYNAGVA